MSLTTPQPGSLTINGHDYELLAFYCDNPNHLTDWDKLYQVPYFGNFWACPITVTFKNDQGDEVTGSFNSAEAAFQASKWWNDPRIVSQFEGLATGKEAFDLKGDLEKRGVATNSNYGDVGREEAMLRILKNKYSTNTVTNSDLQKALLSTKKAYLLEHDKKHRDPPRGPSGWSDNYDGIASRSLNLLGITIMKVRAFYGGSDAPLPESYEVKDFSQEVIKQVAHKHKWSVAADTVVDETT